MPMLAARSLSREWSRDLTMGPGPGLRDLGLLREGARVWAVQ